MQTFDRTKTISRAEWQDYQDRLQALRGVLNASEWQGFPAGTAMLVGFRLFPVSMEEFRIVVYFTGPHAVAAPVEVAGHPIRITRARADFAALDLPAPAITQA